MSAADIPETHDSPMAMARCLVSYLDCPDKVFRRVKAEFGTSPCHETIRDLRAAHLKPMPYADPPLPTDAYRPMDEAGRAAKASALFLDRLNAERLSTQSTGARLCHSEFVPPSERDAA